MPPSGDVLPFWDPARWAGSIGSLERKPGWIAELVEDDGEARRLLGLDGLGEVLRAGREWPLPAQAASLADACERVRELLPVLGPGRVLRGAPPGAAVEVRWVRRGLRIGPALAVAFGTEECVTVSDGEGRLALLEERRPDRDALAALLRDEAAFGAAVRAGRLTKWHTGWLGSALARRAFVALASSPADLGRLSALLPVDGGAAA